MAPFTVNGMAAPLKETVVAPRKWSPDIRKIKEVLRLRYELGLGQRQIARSCSLGLGTVHDYLSRGERANLRWPPPEDWDEARVAAELFGSALHGRKVGQILIRSASGR